ncbi:bacillithiol biosynthesis BshC [Candidatus Poribacteria bacterium]|nr:bacillithiol biosynthesis BshC [Candidatus Poribacteria bacterium]
MVTHPVHGNILRTAAREELAAGIEQSPECFSPNAALRPIVQDFALPVVAYMGGPSEVLYHAQIGPLYGHFGVFRPAVVPRPSAILVEPRIRRFADKLRVNIRHAVEGGPDSVMAAAARAATAGGLQSAARDHLAKASGAIQQLETALAALTSDTGVVKAAEKLRRGFEESSAKLLERVESHALRADQETASQAQRLSEALWPGGEPQERVVGALSPLMRTTGLDGPSRVGELLDPDPAAMQVIELANLQSASG